MLESEVKLVKDHLRALNPYNKLAHPESWKAIDKVKAELAIQKSLLK
jgi:hypothetical protein